MTGPGEGTTLPPQDPSELFAGPLTPDAALQVEETMHRVAGSTVPDPSDLAALDALAGTVHAEEVFVGSGQATGDEVVLEAQTVYSRTTTGTDGKPHVEEIDPMVGKALADYVQWRQGGVGAESSPQDSPSWAAAPKPQTNTAGKEHLPLTPEEEQIDALLKAMHPGKGSPRTISPEDKARLDKLAESVERTETPDGNGGVNYSYERVEKQPDGAVVRTPLQKGLGARLYGHNKAAKAAKKHADDQAAQQPKNPPTPSPTPAGRRSGDTPDSTRPSRQRQQNQPPRTTPQQAAATLKRLEKASRAETVHSLLAAYRMGNLPPRTGRTAERLGVCSGGAQRERIDRGRQSDELLIHNGSGLYAIASGIPGAAEHRTGQTSNLSQSASEAIAILEEIADFLPEPTSPDEARWQMEDIMEIIREELPQRTSETNDAMITIARVVEFSGRRFLMTVQAGTNEVALYSNGIRRTLSKQQGARGFYTHSLGRGVASKDVYTFDEMFDGDRVLIASDGIVGSNDFRQKPLTRDQYNTIFEGDPNPRSGRRPNMSDGDTVAQAALQAALAREAEDINRAQQARGIPVIDDMAAIGLAFGASAVSRNYQEGSHEIYSGQLRGQFKDRTQPDRLVGPERQLSQRERAATAFANSATARLAVGTVFGTPWALVRGLSPFVPDRMTLDWLVNTVGGRDNGDEIHVPRWGDLFARRRQERRDRRVAARRARRGL